MLNAREILLDDYLSRLRWRPWWRRQPHRCDRV